MSFHHDVHQDDRHCHGHNGKFIDSTQWLIDSSSDLAIGTVVRSGSVTLFDAMIAIEIFADRMDSGLTTPADLRQPPHDIAFLEKLNNLTSVEVASAIVLLFRAFSTYISGAGTLSNTIFTSIFVRSATVIPRQSSFASETLRLFAISLVRCSFHFVNLFSRLGLYEEEDFSIEHTSLELLDGLDDASLLAKLDSLLPDLVDAKQPDELSLVAGPLVLVIRNLLAFVLQMNSSPSTTIAATASPLVQSASLNIASLEHIAVAHVFSSQVDDQFTWDLGFNPRALRHLTIHCPPRNAPWLSLAHSCDLWGRIATQLAAVSQLQTGSHLSPSGLLAVVEHATSWEQVARSVLHLVLFAQSGMINGRLFQEHMQDWLLEITGAPFASSPGVIDSLVAGSVRASVQGNVLLRSANVIRSLEAEVHGQLAHLSNLLFRAVEPVIRNAFRAFVHNPARSRRLLFKVCQQLAALEDSAASIDSEITILLNDSRLPRFFGHWIGYLKDRWAVFELDLGRRLDMFVGHESHSLLFIHNALMKTLHDRLLALRDCHVAAHTMVSSSTASSPSHTPKPRPKKRPGKPVSILLASHPITTTKVQPSIPELLKAELAMAEFRSAIALVTMSLYSVMQPLPTHPSLASLLGSLASVPDRSTHFQQRFRYWQRFASTSIPLTFSAMESMYQESVRQPADTLSEARKTFMRGQASSFSIVTPSLFGACDAAQAVLNVTGAVQEHESEVQTVLTCSAAVLSAVEDAFRPASATHSQFRAGKKPHGRGGQRHKRQDQNKALQLDEFRTKFRVSISWSPNYCIGLLSLQPQQFEHGSQDVTEGVGSMRVSGATG